MAQFLKSASATTIMALKILLFLLFQNKPLVLFKLSCYSVLTRLQVLVYLLLLRRYFF